MSLREVRIFEIVIDIQNTRLYTCMTAETFPWFVMAETKSQGSMDIKCYCRKPCCHHYQLT